MHDGSPTPTLAAVDLAERQAVAGGYVAPVRRAMVTQPVMTYAEFFRERQDARYAVGKGRFRGVPAAWQRKS